MFACPKCQTPVAEKGCAACGFEPTRVGSLPVFYTDSPVSKQYQEIGRFYDELYGKYAEPWNQLANRGAEFNAYVASLVARDNPKRVIEIGCGEGYLLKEMTAPERAGIEISLRAAQLAAGRSGAQLCVGCAEELPFVTGYFDCAVSIGVMTHFVDDVAATRQIHRVLGLGGLYVLGIFLRPSLLERVTAKCAEFKRRRPSLGSLIRWMLRKGRRAVKPAEDNSLERKDKQPVERFYTHTEFRSVLETCGFETREVITKRNRPDSPLAGLHFRLYILQKH